ncbi:MAG: hypothetical protein HY235_07585 [Acidobacteria bacterium]|nr:hypothetical protein [Acidobacteriota bacterium]
MALLILAWPGGADIIDRIAVTVGDRVITESMILDQIRLSAFYEDREPEFTPAARRLASETLISRVLLLREMDDARFPEPPMSAVAASWREIQADRHWDENALRQELARRRLEEEEVRRFLQLMIRSVEFISLRFRRGVQVTSGEIAAYYEKEYKEWWIRQHPRQPVPPLDDVSEDIEGWIIDAKTDTASEEWLKQARSAAKIRHREE